MDIEAHLLDGPPELVVWVPVTLVEDEDGVVDGRVERRDVKDESLRSGLVLCEQMPLSFRRVSLSPLHQSQPYVSNVLLRILRTLATITTNS